MAYYALPEQYGGMTLKQIRDKTGMAFRPDVLAGFGSINENTPLTAGQSYEFNLPESYAAGSSESQALGNIFRPGKSPGEQLLEQQQAEAKAAKTDFLGRYTTAVEGLEPLPDIYSRLTSPGGRFEELPGVRESAFLLGQTIRDLPEIIQQKAKGYGGVTESNVQRKIAQEVGEQSKALATILPSLESMEGRFGEQLGLEFQQRMEALLPFETEATLLDEYLKGQVTLYNTQIAGQLSNELQKIINQGLRDVQELQNIVSLAKAENDYFSSSWIDSEGMKKLVNNRTGEVIATLPGAKTTTGNGIIPRKDRPSATVSTGQTGAESLEDLWQAGGFVAG